MENTPSLYNTLVQVLGQPTNWVDLRHLKTLAWMMVGLIHAGWINLTAWTPYVVSRAQYSQSTAACLTHLESFTIHAASESSKAKRPWEQR